MQVGTEGSRLPLAADQGIIGRALSFGDAEGEECKGGGNVPLWVDGGEPCS